MKTLDIVITMAGEGRRFREAGYKVPKYQIIAHGKTLFEWSLSSLSGFFAHTFQYIFIVLKQDNACGFINRICTKMNLSPIKIIEIDTITDGQATTASLAGKEWVKEHELLIYNIDTYIEPNNMRYNQIKGDGFIPCFKGDGDHWSFVKLDNTGKAEIVKEKERISENCTVGAYYFKSCALYEQAYKEYYNSPVAIKEKYVAPLYNHLIQQGKEIRIADIPVQSVHVLGTPAELSIFESKYDCKNCS
ncbi:glycosyltransferase family 2 protein [Breznakiellaceae bacterium SP9]